MKDHTERVHAGFIHTEGTQVAVSAVWKQEAVKCGWLWSKTQCRDYQADIIDRVIVCMLCFGKVSSKCVDWDVLGNLVFFQNNWWSKASGWITIYFLLSNLNSYFIHDIKWRLSCFPKWRSRPRFKNFGTDNIVPCGIHKTMDETISSDLEAGRHSTTVSIKPQTTGYKKLADQLEDSLSLPLHIPHDSGRTSPASFTIKQNLFRKPKQLKIRFIPLI